MFNNPFLQTYTKADATWEILIMLLVAFLLGAFLGWILWGGRIRKLTSDIAGLNSQITALNGKVSESEAALLAEKDISRQLKLDLEACSGRRKQLEVENVTLESHIRSLESELKSARAQAAMPLSSPPVEPPAPQPEEEKEALPEPEIIEDVTEEAPVKEPDVIEIDLTGVFTGTEPAADAPAPPGAVVEELSLPVVAPKRKKKEDLKMVEGIGPAIEKLLHAADIKTFAQLADATPDRLREILLAAGERYRIHNPDTWPQQSALLRDDKMEEFQKLTSELKGGRIQ